MENLDLKTLSASDCANHASIQAQKVLQMQLNELKSERNLLRMILKDLHDHSQEEKNSCASLRARLFSYLNFCDIMEQSASYQQLKIETLLVKMCQNHRELTKKANIEIYFDDFPMLLGNSSRADALFTNLYMFSALDVTDAKYIHIEYETSRSGNRLLWEIGHENSGQLLATSQMIKKSTFLMLAEKLAPALCAKLSTHVTSSQVLIELLIE